MAVPSDAIDLERAYNRHLAASSIESVPRRTKIMAMFYAAECGLKCLFMRTENIGTTSDLKARVAGHLNIARRHVDMHDVELLCQAVSVLPVDTGPSPGSFTLFLQTHQVYRIHEAARYGIKLPDAYLIAVETWLSEIDKAIRGRMRPGI